MYWSSKSQILGA